jgi:arabinan endo-1,5-alpha-L-arabinosidase
MERSHRRTLTMCSSARAFVCTSFVAFAACGSPSSTNDDAKPSDDGPATVCSTRIAYGSRWIRPADHPDAFDVVDGEVTWDGTCITEGANSFATLSNGFKPRFTGSFGCEIALDTTGCGSPPGCATRITYGAAWSPPANHAAQYDDVGGRVFSDNTCVPAGSSSRIELSNGWVPYFAGNGTCGIALRWTGCHGVYENPVKDGCADPGVAFDGTRYIMSCTSGNAANAFPLWVSTDLVHWSQSGHILPAAARPAWAKSDFWAPEIHEVGSRWIAVWSARAANGRLSIGAASAADPLGPYTALSTPLLDNANVGLIDAHVVDADGTSYLVWKEDGNAQGAATPIRIRKLASDALSFASASAPALITNDRAWEGNLVEAPFIIEHDGSYFLFYSGNAYYDDRYAVGVARATAVTGPYTKAAAPIVTSSSKWIGPGHNSIVEGPGGDLYMVYHAWEQGHVNGAGDRRHGLVDQVQWRDGWPVVVGAPSNASRPLP